MEGRLALCALLLLSGTLAEDVEELWCDWVEVEEWPALGSHCPAVPDGGNVTICCSCCCPSSWWLSQEDALDQEERLAEDKPTAASGAATHDTRNACGTQVRGHLERGEGKERGAVAPREPWQRERPTDPASKLRRLSTLVTSWADNSNKGTAEQMELSRDCSSTIPDYSEDTFASFSEEEGERCRQYENESFESYYSGEELEWPAESDQSENTRQPSSQNDEEQEKDFLNSTVAENSRIQKWISLLKVDRPTTELAECASKPENALIKATEASEKELYALRYFCTIKINQLGHLPSSVLLNMHKHNNQKPGFTSEKVLMHGVNHIVPDQLVNKLHLKNIKETMKQLAETEMHQPSQCLDCKKKRAELAKDTFLRRKKTLMEWILLQEKLENHIYTKDALVLIGEIHQSLPKPSEDPRNIWQELNKRALQA
ncbi:uncharacterized protein C8orf48 homolog [Eublepharis macularius]|uniref:Uncharacterized protein C8orf48 homolog n=1 Tax=Eublepharis macularius TaxID=481883 RepID=A0AA97KBB4_EUBMA|nr:uncharacterized protein C8orf48 homolog [Eublepharis macularius]